ncbi:MAG: gluconokinase [Blastocatellia bacterium]|jgi:gluconokinase|nr:gluconokinase [Blastocatellia bacterium]
MSTVLDEAVLEDRPEIDLSVLAASLRTEPEGTVVLAIDIGTSGVRSSLFDHCGHEIPGSQVSLSHESPDLTRGVDLDANALIEFVKVALDIAQARAETLVSRIDYVAVSCFWHSLLGIDNEGRATTPLFGWADTRATEAVTELRSKYDERQVHPRTGARFHPSYWPAKLLWLKHERRAQFDQTTQWLSLSDYLFLQLFGYETTSVSMASATGLFNQHTCDWDLDLLAGLGISLKQLPAIAEPGDTLQGLFLDYAVRWPLLNGAAWFPAIGDGAANNIGAGCVDPGRAALMIGTSGALRVLYDGNAPATLPPELFCYRADRSRVVIGGALSDGGGLYRWMKESLALNYDEAELEAEFRSMQPDEHGLTILPFWSGERATGWSGAAQGSITGLTTRTRPVDILCAAMEAVCYRFALLAQALNRVAPETKIVAAGNALRSSPVWAQMLSDVLGRPIELSPLNEASSRGAALLALEAAGKIDSIETVDFEISVAPVIYEPDLNRHARYTEAIARQEKLYQKLIGPDILL